MSEIIYHIVYTKRNKQVVMYKENTYINSSLGYDSIIFNDTNNIMGLMDKRINLKWYENTNYICWNYNQRIHIFVRDPKIAIKIFTDNNIKDYKSKL